jgi:hypothetical protein
VICDDDPTAPGPNASAFVSEVPAPKAGLRSGDMVLLAECFDARRSPPAVAPPAA